MEGRQQVSGTHKMNLTMNIGGSHLGSRTPPKVVCTGESVDYRS
uniref:Uncharacterized protein n=1 Tax=Trichinella nativa TaxID=6335 RepID=A0A0V1KJT3_9BILA